MHFTDLKRLSKETSISIHYLRRMASLGMPHYRVGRKILVDPSEFTEWFKETHLGISSEDYGYMARLFDENFR